MQDVITANAETPEIPAQAEQTPSAVAPENEGADELSNLFGYLKENGSKLTADGDIAHVDQRPESESEAESTPSPTTEPEVEPSPVVDPEEDDEPQEGQPEKPPANADKKRALLRLMKNEPGTPLAEAMRRVGIVAPATQAPESAPDAPVQPAADPAQALRDEIAALEKEEEAAATAFNNISQFRLGKQVRAKQSQLAKLEAKAELQAEATQTRQADTHQAAVLNTWTDVAKEFPEASQTGSALHQALQAKIDATHKANPAFFGDPDWPAMLTASVARKLGLAPRAPAAAAPTPSPTSPAPKPAPVIPAVAPRKSSVPAPAPGGSRSAAPVVASTPESDDPDDYFSFLRTHGSKG
jgi:hypothetical protein